MDNHTKGFNDDLWNRAMEIGKNLRNYATETGSKKTKDSVKHVKPTVGWQGTFPSERFII